MNNIKDSQTSKFLRSESDFEHSKYITEAILEPLYSQFAQVIQGNSAQIPPTLLRETHHEIESRFTAFQRSFVYFLAASNQDISRLASSLSNLNCWEELHSLIQATITPDELLFIVEVEPSLIKPSFFEHLFERIINVTSAFIENCDKPLSRFKDEVEFVNCQTSPHPRKRVGKLSRKQICALSAGAEAFSAAIRDQILEFKKERFQFYQQGISNSDHFRILEEVEADEARFAQNLLRYLENYYSRNSNQNDLFNIVDKLTESHAAWDSYWTAIDGGRWFFPSLDAAPHSAEVYANFARMISPIFSQREMERLSEDLMTDSEIRSASYLFDRLLQVARWHLEVIFPLKEHIGHTLPLGKTEEYVYPETLDVSE